jgi:hypothetical protein
MASAEVRTGEGKLYLFVAIDRTSKFAVARLYDEATTRRPASSWRSCSPSSPTASTRS